MPDNVQLFHMNPPLKNHRVASVICLSPGAGDLKNRINDACSLSDQARVIFLTVSPMYRSSSSSYRFDVLYIPDERDPDVEEIQ